MSKVNRTLNTLGFLMVKDLGGGSRQTVITPPVRLKFKLVVRSMGFEGLQSQDPVPAPPPAIVGGPRQASVSSSVN